VHLNYLRLKLAKSVNLKDIQDKVTISADLRKQLELEHHFSKAEAEKKLVI